MLQTVAAKPPPFPAGPGVTVQPLESGDSGVIRAANA